MKRIATIKGLGGESERALLDIINGLNDRLNKLETPQALTDLKTTPQFAQEQQTIRLAAGTPVTLPRARTENQNATINILLEGSGSSKVDAKDSTVNGGASITISTAGLYPFRNNGNGGWFTATGGVTIASALGATTSGSAGPTGATGAAGGRGVQGVPGFAGNDGADGLDGKDGSPGAQGTPGSIGPPGIPGSDGADGKDGADGLNGTIGPTGLQGPPGIQGNDGPEGVAGIDGQDGLPGSPGTPGATGATGVNGAPGMPGNDGMDGADGRDGVDGMPGLSGAAGGTGPTGATGPTGPQGIPGNDGLEGPPGMDGQDGLPGAPGVAGSTGPTGATGAGSNGAPGSMGTDGQDGPEGLPGMPGPAGPPGTIPPTPGIVLNTTSMKLQVITTTTAAMAFETNYTDFLPGIFTPGHTEATSASAVTTDIVPAPAAANIQRVIHELTILNTDTTFSQVVSVQLAPTPTLVLTSINLGPGERIEYTSDRGFRVFQSNGAEKSALVPAGFTLTGEVTTVGNVATVTRSTDYDSIPWTGPHAFSDTVRGVTRLAQTMSANVNDLDVTSVTATSQAPTAFGFLLTGMIAVGEGQWVWIQNNQTIRTFSIAHQNSGSVAANRFRCPGGVDYIVPPQSGVWARYSVGFWALASLRANSMIKRTMVQTPGAFSVTLDINTSWFTAEWVGGGGGSGGVVAATSGEFCASGGGGAGGYCKTINIFVPGATAVTGTLGALGAGGSSAGGDGGTGGTTTVTYNAVSTIATGGAGGKGQTNGAGQAAATTYGQITAGGAGGAAGTSVFGTNGGDGHPAFMWGVNGNAGVGAAMAGNGGGSFFGSGGFGATFVGVGTSTGGTAQAYGSGGGGSCAASSGASNAAGGAPGAQAVIIIEEFSGTTPTEAVV